MMRSAGYVLKFEAPLSHAPDDFMGFAFVDDTNIYANIFTSTNMDTRTLINRICKFYTITQSFGIYLLDCIIFYWLLRVNVKN